MAQASTETIKIRQEVTALWDALAVIHDVNEKYTSLGGQSFFEGYLGPPGVPVTDLDVADFVTAVASLQNLITWLDTHGPNLAKLRI